MSKFGNLINQAKGKSNKEEQNFDKGYTQNTEAEITNAKNGKPENQIKSEKSVNLSIKVAENLRRHWVAEAKREGTSITAEVTEALNRRFGLPK